MAYQEEEGEELSYIDSSPFSNTVYHVEFEHQFNFFIVPFFLTLKPMF